MRAGSEQFLIKDYAFYDCAATAVLGASTIAVYEALRRFVWRSREKGVPKARRAWEDGKLVAVVCQTKLALMVGVSRPTLTKALSKLRAVGWIRGEEGRYGEALCYELGAHRPGQGEWFYADGELQELWAELMILAELEGYKNPAYLELDQRILFAQLWFEEREQVERIFPPLPHEVESFFPPGGKILPTRWKEFFHRIGENKYINRIGESESGRFAADTRPSPLTGEEPDSPIKKTNSKNEEDVGTSNGKNDFLHPPIEVNFDKMAASNSKVSHVDSEESHEGSEKSDEERRQAVAAALSAGKQKADQQKQANEAKRRVKAQRTAQVKQKQAKEQKAANLKGRSYPRDVVEAAKKAWKTYTDLIEKVDPEFVVPRWAANGNVKARGQMCQLIEMYGGPATEQALQYLVGNWEVIGTRYFKNSPGGIPNLGRLVVLHEQIYREAVLWARHREVLQEWNDWYKGREYTAPRPPAELRARYDSAREALQSLGLGA